MKGQGPMQKQDYWTCEICGKETVTRWSYVNFSPNGTFLHSSCCKKKSKTYLDVFKGHPNPGNLWVPERDFGQRPNANYVRAGEGTVYRADIDRDTHTYKETYCKDAEAREEFARTFARFLEVFIRRN